MIIKKKKKKQATVKISRVFVMHGEGQTSNSWNITKKNVNVWSTRGLRGLISNGVWTRS